jgi:hypothetical protein
MKDRDAIMKQALVRLQAIKTLAEYKAARMDIIELIRMIMTSAIEVLSAFLENMLTMSPGEQQAESAKFQDGDFLISSDVMQEIERLNNLPGAGKYAESFSLELEKIMKPQMEEFEQQMGRLMENLMSSFMGSMADAMGSSFSNISDEPGSEEEKEFLFDNENPDTLFILYPLYVSKLLSDLEENRESLIENVVMEVDSYKYRLDDFFLPGYDDYWEEDKRKIAEIQRHIDRLMPEIDREFERIAAASGSPGDVGKIKDEMTERIRPAMTELNKLLAVKREEWKKKGL